MKKIGLVIVGVACMALLFGCSSPEPAHDAASVADPLDVAVHEAHLAEPEDNEIQSNVAPDEEISVERVNFAELFDVALEDEYFMKTVDAVFADFSNYIGKTVRLEGVFEYFGMDTIYRQVFRRAGTC
ncbi:MAG: hypothetical protein FWC75_03025 [Oscillospiraceae bacterium]|nr:hypothetical protein [Oscillospiraceae bacterium]